jgi:hypothetical protein
VRLEVVRLEMGMRGCRKGIRYAVKYMLLPFFPNLVMAHIPHEVLRKHR